ncbi:uncharacterized protein LOC113222463 [Piliocolobus tephrosceles]|uniref:uncharacterized protein LOC113222463 n=1 Tax=Piliocolobus tephrosceles TaxID=591936 RepID=UPI000E6B46B6|nr:uncharacterized protein LOC113222463 [Piliocolobus tephrosceles]
MNIYDDVMDKTYMVFDENLLEDNGESSDGVLEEAEQLIENNLLNNSDHREENTDLYTIDSIFDGNFGNINISTYQRNSPNTAKLLHSLVYVITMFMWVVHNKCFMLTDHGSRYALSSTVDPQLVKDMQPLMSTSLLNQDPENNFLEILFDAIISEANNFEQRNEEEMIDEDDNNVDDDLHNNISNNLMVCTESLQLNIPFEINHDNKLRNSYKSIKPNEKLIIGNNNKLIYSNKSTKLRGKPFVDINDLKKILESIQQNEQVHTNNTDDTSDKYGYDSKDNTDD